MVRSRYHYPCYTLYIPSISLYIPSISLYIPSMFLHIPSISFYIPSISLYIPSISLYIPSIFLYIPSISLYIPSPPSHTLITLLIGGWRLGLAWLPDKLVQLGLMDTLLGIGTIQLYNDCTHHNMSSHFIVMTVHHYDCTPVHLYTIYILYTSLLYKHRKRTHVLPPSSKWLLQYYYSTTM